MTVKQEVSAVEQEPRAADVPPVFISPEEPTSTAVISGQVDQVLLLITTDTLSPCTR